MTRFGTVMMGTKQEKVPQCSFPFQPLKFCPLSKKLYYTNTLSGLDLGSKNPLYSLPWVPFIFPPSEQIMAEDQEYGALVPLCYVLQEEVPLDPTGGSCRYGTSSCAI